MNAFIKFLKKLGNQLLGRANDTFDKYQDPIVALRQERRNIDSIIDEMGEKYMEVSTNSKEIRHMIDSSQKEYDKYVTEAKAAKENDDQPAAERAASRALRIKDRIDSMSDNSEEQLLIISTTVDELRLKSEDLQFEERHLETMYAAAKLENKVLELDSPVSTGGHSIEAVLEDARAKVREAKHKAEARREMNQALSDKEETKYSTQTADQRTTEFLNGL